MSTRLTRDQIEGFDRDGYIAIDRLVDDNALSSLREAYDAIIAGDVRAAGDRQLGGIIRQVMIPSQAHPTFDRNQALERGEDIARQLCGWTDVQRTFDMLIYKPPGQTAETPWHQDLSYLHKPFTRPGTMAKVTTLQYWVPLDDVDEENGCMSFIPGGIHKQPMLEHRVASGDPADDGRLLALVDPAGQVDLSTAVTCPLSAGGCTIHGPGAVHYTSGNTSKDRPRRAYIFNLIGS